MLFKISLIERSIPREWRRDNLMPISKIGDKSRPELKTSITNECNLQDTQENNQETGYLGWQEILNPFAG